MTIPTHEAAINPYPGNGELFVLFAGHAQTPPLHRIGPQVLDYHLVHLVLSGHGRFRCRDREYELKRGDCFFIFPGELQSYVSDEKDPWRYRWIAFGGSHADTLLAQLDITPSNPIARADQVERTAALFRHIQHLLSRGEPSCGLQTEGYLRIMLSLFQKKPLASRKEEERWSESKRQVEKAIRWLTLQYAQPITIASMAKALGYHRTHLTKIFKEHTGMPPMTYLLKIRMERARLLMKDERLTLQQIASSVGFHDPLYFSRKFKSWYGKSPSEYREEWKQRPFDGCSI